MELTCRQRCVRYLQRHPDTWVPSGTIQRIAAQKSTYTPSNVSRRLREAAEEGEIQVKIIEGHANYKWSGVSENRRREALTAFDEL